MKKSKYLLGCTFFLLLAFHFAGCEPVTDDGTYVDPITLYEKVNGSWKLSDITQIDETAKTMGISPSELKLTEQFDFTSFAIALNVDAAQTPTSYLVSGAAPELFPNQGFWDLNTSFPYANAKAPTINLYSDQAKTTLIGQLSITSIPGAKPEMELKLSRSSDGVPFVSYVYKLITAN
ncbi:MAG: DUF5004 domain-containing protein [Dysgonamonadaceae bacterium]|jgi:hypothetical protein|nr:DUF5004 domain-containing protein [Dysgonamonadaceae bacterium]